MTELITDKEHAMREAIAAVEDESDYRLVLTLAESCEFEALLAAARIRLRRRVADLGEFGIYDD